MEFTGHIGLIWEQTKVPLVVPVLKVMVVLCLAMSVMLFVERVYMGIVIVFVKLFRRRPEKMYKWEPMKDDVELGNLGYPMVLVQIPMYNEKEVRTLRLIYTCLFRLICLGLDLCWIYRYTSCQLELHVDFHGQLIGS